MRADGPRPLPPPLIVNARRETDDSPPLMIVTHDSILLPSGEVYPRDELAKLIATEPSSLIVCHNAGVLLSQLDRIFDTNPRWQFRVSPKNIPTWEGSNESKKRRTTRANETVVAFFGFKRAGGKVKSHYHYPLDPLCFTGRSATSLYPGLCEMDALRRWGEDVQAFCRENRLKVRPTAGGLAGQLLRDRRFYPNPRRKVPKMTNARAREHLPGNHYQLFAGTSRSHNAYYLDQNSAHHSAARDVPLPDANSLYARGRYHDPEDVNLWCRSGSSRFDRIMSMHGLFKVWLHVPFPQKFGPPCTHERGRKVAYIYSNELDYLRELGCMIEGVIACWASPDTDTGLPRYAAWCQDQLDASTSERRAWLKPTLLASYGILAARPRRMEFGYKHAENSKPGWYLVGGSRLRVQYKETERELESGIVNVIHRGIIEAETRLRSLKFARYLDGLGCNILAIYADSVFVESDCQLPFLPDGWKLSDQLTNLLFLNPVSFTSRELTKLPGIPDSHELAKLRRLQSVRSTVGLTREKTRKMQAKA